MSKKKEIRKQVRKAEVKKEKVLKMTPIIDNDVTDLNYYDDHIYTDSYKQLTLPTPP